MDSEKIKKAIGILKNGGVGVLPTDTLYGVVGQALNKVTIERIYKIKNRSDNKPFIVLISSIEDLAKLKINIDENTREFLLSAWPGPVSIILECKDESLKYLHKGMDVAVRWPKNDSLEQIIKEVGPIVAPSANPEGMEPARTVDEAKIYFGDSVDFYLDGGVLEGEPSTLVSVINGDIKVLRQGRFKIV